jgi:hypothetical protein
MRIDQMHPTDALSKAGDLGSFLHCAVGALGEADDGFLPNKSGWHGLLLVTELLLDLTHRAGEGQEQHKMP